MDNKANELLRITQDIQNCKACKEGTTGKIVPGEGNPNAKVMFVGEAPGRQEAATGRPFIGRSGQLLRSLIQESGLLEEDVFITSVGKYLPVTGTPTPKQILHGREHLLRQIAVINPKIIVLLGNVAIQGVLGEKLPVKSVHGTIREKDNRAYFITLHPAAALRFPPLRKELASDFQKLKKYITDTM